MGTCNLQPLSPDVYKRQAIDDATIMECIYDTLNDHNIDIPFPQREITIKQVNN